MIVIKEGVVFKELHSHIYGIFSIIDALFIKYGDTCVITSANDGKHKIDSFHYINDAIDLRSHNLPSKNKQDVFNELQHTLGGDYYVIFEDQGGVNEHLHIQFNPRK